MERKNKQKGFGFYFFKPKPIKLGSRYELWRGVIDEYIDACYTYNENMRML